MSSRKYAKRLDAKCQDVFIVRDA